MTYAVPAPPADASITVKQVDRRTISVDFPACPEALARLLNEAAVGGFTLTGAGTDNEGVLALNLTREGNV